MLPADLPDDYVLSFLIGEIVRNDVFVESEVRLLWHELAAVGLSTEERERDLARVIKQVRKMLQSDKVPSEFRALCIEVLDRVGAAHRLRSVLAHDQWMRMRSYRPNEIWSMRRPKSQRPIADLEECAADLLTLAWRTRGLWVIAPYWLGGDTVTHHTDPDDLHSWTRVAMGHIADDRHATYGTPGDAPHPPGGFPPAE